MKDLQWKSMFEEKTVMKWAWWISPHFTYSKMAPMTMFFGSTVGRSLSECTTKSTLISSNLWVIFWKQSFRLENFKRSTLKGHWILLLFFFIQYFRLFFTYPPLVAGRKTDGKRSASPQTPRNSRGLVASGPKITTGRKPITISTLPRSPPTLYQTHLQIYTRLVLAQTKSD